MSCFSLHLASLVLHAVDGGGDEGVKSDGDPPKAEPHSYHILSVLFTRACLTGGQGQMNEMFDLS